MLKPLERMWARVENEKADSDTAFFYGLLNLGEHLLKLSIAGIVAAIQDDKSRLRYRHEHDLVRANSIGAWAKTLDDILVGPTAGMILSNAQEEQRALTERLGKASWQFRAAHELNLVLRELDPNTPSLPERLQGKNWFRLFVQLRNDTRGHGAHGAGRLSGFCGPIEDSLRLLSENFPLFGREWAYLRRNLSGKYRISRLSESTDSFEYLKKTNTENLRDGVYVFLGRPVLVELLTSDADLSDFYLPNGNFTDAHYEIQSYITGDRVQLLSTPYLVPTDLPGSQTEGLGNLEVEGNCFVNLPPQVKDYVSRPVLEEELRKLLLDDHHPIITLGGSGGIGKTSLALRVLHELVYRDRFNAVLWFSARDIDLFTEGAKQVQPRVINEEDASMDFARLLQLQLDRKHRLEFLARCLGHARFPHELLKVDWAEQKSANDWPTLFVFDNFETVTRPVEFFKWLDTHIRTPNKILITTRVRTFQGDYAVSVEGMDEEECRKLIAQTANLLGISGLVTETYQQDMIRESQGHPYVIKILLGEIAKSRQTQKLARIFANRTDILQALFERTYRNLSPAAQRVFLTICGWRSAIPALVLEAVILHSHSDEIFDISAAIDELHHSSLIDLSESEGSEVFLSVPAVAALFGRGKSETSPLNAQLRADLDLLQHLGAVQLTEVRRGAGSRIRRFVRSIGTDGDRLSYYRPMFEFLARKNPSVWRDLAERYEEIEDFSNAKDALRYYLEQTDKQTWLATLADLTRLCSRTGDLRGEIDALVKRAELDDVPYAVISNVVNRFNSRMRADYSVFNGDEKLVYTKRLRQVMEPRVSEANATDFSRLAWLCRRDFDELAADRYIRDGLALEPDNEYCLRFADNRKP